MSMKIQKGVVKYQDRTDIVCSYGVKEDGTQYYFLDGEDKKRFKNGNRIVTTALIEAVDPMVRANNIGVIDEEGNEIIPCQHRAVRPVNDDIILAELANPVTAAVIEANELKNDATQATKLVSTPSFIKEKMNQKMGDAGRYIFNDQFSEATVYDINGNNLVNGEYFSFIGMADGKLYFSTNVLDSDIVEYSILPPDVQSDITPNSDSNSIKVDEVEVSTQVVEEALENTMTMPPVSEEKPVEDVAPEVESDSLESSVEAVASEKVTPADLDVSENVVSENVSDFEEKPVENVTQETTSEDVVSEEVTTEVVSEDVPEEEIPEDLVTLSDAILNEDETPDNTVDDVSVPEEVVVEDKVDDTTLDHMFSDMKTDDTDEDIFKDSVVKKDTIDYVNHYEDFDSIDYQNRNDTIMSDVARSMTELIKQNKELMSQNKELMNQNEGLKNSLDESQRKVEKLNVSRQDILDSLKLQEQKNDVLSDGVRSLKANISRLETRNQILENKNHEKDEELKALRKDVKELRDDLRAETAGKEELAKILGEAKTLLGENEDEYSQDSYYRYVA